MPDKTFQVYASVQRAQAVPDKTFQVYASVQIAQAVASMCYFKNLQYVIRDALLVLLGLVSSGSHASY